jgi:hypothetical protein
MEKSWDRVPCIILLGMMILFAGETMAKERSGYADLVDLFADWRDFEKPPMRDGAPDYTAERFEKADA